MLNQRKGIKNRLQNDYKLKDAYKYFVTKYNYKNGVIPRTIEYNTYRNIVEDFNKEVWNHILYKSRSYKLPLQLGEIVVNRKMLNTSELITPNKLKIDWNLTRKYDKKIYHLNEHRNGGVYKIKWRGNKKFINCKLFSFTPTRKIKRTLAHILKNNPEIDYYL